ncbi:hypothetical protein BN1723_015650, partial [Verticillium longisporum]
NYHTMFGGMREAIRMGSRLGFWTLLAFGLESTVDRYRGKTDFLSTVLSSVSVAGAFSLWNRFSLPTAARTAKYGLLFGLVYGGMQDVVGLARGRPVSYVEFFRRKFREWSREHGWRVAKRPGVDYFLRYLSQYYELVLFTSVPFAIGEPLVRKLDPFRFIMWPLYREATKYNDGEIVKDLSYLNRDLSKVIIIDSKASHVRNQPENAIVLDKWTGDSKDKDLVGLIPFLEYIHTMQYGDVRKVLKSFEGKHIPTEFARREAIARSEFEKQLAAKGKKTPSGMGMLGGMLGLKPSNMALMQSPDGELSPAEAFAQGKMLQDIARERGQRNYELLEKEIRENGAKWLKEEAEMQEKAQQEALNSMMGSFSGWFVPSKTEENPADGKKA